MFALNQKFPNSPFCPPPGYGRCGGRRLVFWAGQGLAFRQTPSRILLSLPPPRTSGAPWGPFWSTAGTGDANPYSQTYFGDALDLQVTKSRSESAPPGQRTSIRTFLDGFLAAAAASPAPHGWRLLKGALACSQSHFSPRLQWW